MNSALEDSEVATAVDGGEGVWSQATEVPSHASHANANDASFEILERVDEEMAAAKAEEERLAANAAASAKAEEERLAADAAAAAKAEEERLAADAAAATKAEEERLAADAAAATKAAEETLAADAAAAAKVLRLAARRETDEEVGVKRFRHDPSVWPNHI